MSHDWRRIRSSLKLYEKGSKVLTQDINEKVIELRRRAAECYQKAAWNQLLALDHYRESNLEAAERFAQLSFVDQMDATEYAELADAETSFLLELNEEC